MNIVILDDYQDAVRKLQCASRLDAYNAQTAPLLPYYATRDIITEVDGMADIASVAGAIDKALS